MQAAKIGEFFTALKASQRPLVSEGFGFEAVHVAQMAFGPIAAFAGKLREYAEDLRFGDSLMLFFYVSNIVFFSRVFLGFLFSR